MHDHCSHKGVFADWCEQTFSSKVEMYNTYRELMMKQLTGNAAISLEGIKSSFKVIKK
jgi:hypothetical protein